MSTLAEMLHALLMPAWLVLPALSTAASHQVPVIHGCVTYAVLLLYSAQLLTPDRVRNTCVLVVFLTHRLPGGTERASCPVGAV